MRGLKGKTAIVTGGAAGIGAAIVHSTAAAVQPHYVLSELGNIPVRSLATHPEAQDLRLDAVVNERYLREALDLADPAQPPVPALTTSTRSSRPARSSRSLSTTSAIGDRQMLPRQTKQIRLMLRPLPRRNLGARTTGRNAA